MSKLGAAAEAQIMGMNETYRRDRLASVHKTNPTVKVLSKPIRGKFTGIFSDVGPPDFMGVIQKTGRHVIFDCKATDQDKWSLSELADYQARDLEAASPKGLAFVSLWFQREWWVLPWVDALAPLYWAWFEGKAARGRAALTISDIRRIGYKMPEPGDWLHALPAADRGCD